MKIFQPMGRCAVAILCAAGVFAWAANAQEAKIPPIRAAAGTILDFHLQTLLNPIGGDPLDALPPGTVVRVKMLQTVDSRVNRDGDEFRGTVASPLFQGNRVIIQAGAEVRGIFALLRSRSHPAGFRYELLVTRLTDRGNTYAVTASLDPSLFDVASKNSSPAPSDAKPNATQNGAGEKTSPNLH